jgi:hypothetical protein
LFNPYTKAILGAVIVLLSGLVAGWDDSVLTTTEIFTAFGAAIAALGAIWATSPTIKWAVSGLLAGIAALGVSLEDNAFSAQEVISVIGSVLIALYAVYATPNTEVSNAPYQQPVVAAKPPVVAGAKK